ncbi:MAG TPA: pyridoxamine 5'-phosphate oxidase family protein [Micromonosporaceae bacterium]|jgi:nitroimidazol reductase NimA-like FMN-containing flavoprotein (pyridoxamine 5'-phosphate oxidase superfamily)
MSSPTTKLDERFSDPAAVATSWDETRRALETAQMFWISTVRRDGRPHVTPLVAVWLDGALHFCTGTEEQKTVNIRTNPHVILTTGSNGWDGGLDVVVEGDAVRVTDDDVLRHLAEGWATKWDGSWAYVVRDGAFWHSESSAEPVHVFTVAPSKVLAFGKGTFSHTTHRFDRESV